MRILICSAAAIALIGAANLAAAQSSLEKAYLKEFAFLKAEKAELVKRKARLDRDVERKLRQARSEIGGLEGRLLTIQRETQHLDEVLQDAERASEGADRIEQVYEILDRARAPLEVAGIQVLPLKAESTPEQVSATIGLTFEGAAALMKKNGRVRREKGKFFLHDGTLVLGDVVRIGAIAAYGVSAKGAGALAPAGGRKLRLWSDPAGPSARAMVAGGAPAHLRMFLFESLEKAITAKKSKTFLEEVQAGGLIAWVIVALGALGLLMVIVRALTLMMVGAKTESLTREVMELVERGKVRAAQERVERARGAVARVLTATLRNLKAERARLDDVVHEALLNEQPALDRFGAAITVVAAVAPLLGLLGTVTGMIATFDVITEFGTGDPRVLSGGISEALITTKLGLVVAIPMLLLGTMLSGRADALLTKIEHAALRVINRSEGLSVGPALAKPPTSAPGQAIAEPAS